MFSDRNLINRCNVKGDVHQAYTRCKDFFILEFETQVVAAALQVLGMSTLDDTPSKIRIPQLAKGDNGQSILGMLFLHKVSRAILDSFICVNSHSSRIINAILDEEELQQIHSSQMLTPMADSCVDLLGALQLSNMMVKGGEIINNSMTHHQQPQKSFSVTRYLKELSPL